MKSINFTEEELDHLRGYYQIELAEAEKDVDRIKDILSKLGQSKPVRPEITPEKRPAKRGPKPRVSNEQTPAAEPKKRGPKPKVKVEEVVKKERKPRSDKGGVRNKRVKPVTEETLAAEPFTTIIEPRKDKPAISKKAKKKKQLKRRGITLAPMGKPLPKRAPEPELPADEQVQENPE